MYLCVKGIEFTPFYDLFYLVLELFRLHGILCFSFYIEFEVKQVSLSLILVIDNSIPRYLRTRKGRRGHDRMYHYQCNQCLSPLSCEFESRLYMSYSIFLKELEVKETTETNSSTSFFSHLPQN
jgi:hypothetical protein